MFPLGIHIEEASQVRLFVMRYKLNALLIKYFMYKIR